MKGRISSKARTPTAVCRLSNVFAAARRTSGKGSHSVLLLDIAKTKNTIIISVPIKLDFIKVVYSSENLY